MRRRPTINLKVFTSKRERIYREVTPALAFSRNINILQDIDFLPANKMFEATHKSYSKPSSMVDYFRFLLVISNKTDHLRPSLRSGRKWHTSGAKKRIPSKIHVTLTRRFWQSHGRAGERELRLGEHWMKWKEKDDGKSYHNFRTL